MTVRSWLAKRWELIWWEPVTDLVEIPDYRNPLGFSIEFPAIPDEECAFSIGVGRYDDAVEIASQAPTITVSASNVVFTDNVTIRGRLLRNTWLTRMLRRIGFDHPR